MQALIIEETDETPNIVLDKEKGTFEVSGRSLPEDSAEFFDPILKWVSDYAKNPNPTTDFVFKLDYSNTASSKFVHEILLILEKVKGAKVLWYYHEDDEDMEDAGKEFSEQISLPFEFKQYH
jgi:hypothetical protein